MKSFLFFMVLLLFSVNLYSVVIRHDKNLSAYTEYAQQAKFNGVGKFGSIENPESIATFVVIGPKHILTAAHCFIISDTREEKIHLDDENVITVFQPYNHRLALIEDYEFTLNGKKLKGVQLTIHPKYFVDSNTNTNFDLAIIELEEPIDEQVKIPKIYDQFDEKGTVATFVGYGTSGVGNDLKTENLQLKIAGKNTIDSIGGLIHNGHFCKLFADFDEPDRILSNKLGDPTPLDLEFGTSGGDSGGPLFLESDTHELYLIGILSGGGFTNENIEQNKFYSQVNNWTRVATHRKWIKNVLDK